MSGGVYAKLCWRCFLFFFLENLEIPVLTWNRLPSRPFGFFMWPGFKGVILHTEVLHWVCYCFRWYVNLFCKHLYSEVVWVFWCDVNHVDSMTHKYTLCFLSVYFFSRRYLNAASYIIQHFTTYPAYCLNIEGYNILILAVVAIVYPCPYSESYILYK